MTDHEKSPDTSLKTQEKAGEKPQAAPKEIGGRGGLDPVRYGDWELNGRCVDF